MSVSFRDIDFEHWRGCRLVSNGLIELIAPPGFGPRVMGCRFTGGRNLFKIFPDEGPGVRIRGGHRLWVAPERKEVTWVADNDPVEFRELANGLVITGAQEPSTGLRKQMELRFCARPDEVEVVHRITNGNPWTIELAPWTLTQAAPGGIALSGFPPRGKHPAELLPTHPLVMWAYTDLGDPRWTWGRRFFALRQDPAAGEPQKTGLFHAHSWMAYLVEGDLFFKYSKADPALRYPDFGCSLELFTNRFMMELETLGPLQSLSPGATIEHHERWILARGVHLPDLSDASIAAVVEPLIQRVS